MLEFSKLTNGTWKTSDEHGRYGVIFEAHEATNDDRPDEVCIGVDASNGELLFSEHEIDWSADPGADCNNTDYFADDWNPCPNYWELNR